MYTLHSIANASNRAVSIEPPERTPSCSASSCIAHLASKHEHPSDHCTDHMGFLTTVSEAKLRSRIAIEIYVYVYV